MSEPDARPITIVTKRDDITRDLTVAHTTAKSMPDFVLKAMHPVAIIVVRGLRVYLQSFLGIATALQSGFAHKVGIDFDTSDLGGVVMKAAAIAVAPMFFSALQNVIELITKLDETMPQLRA